MALSDTISVPGHRLHVRRALGTHTTRVKSASNGACLPPRAVGDDGITTDAPRKHCACVAATHRTPCLHQRVNGHANIKSFKSRPALGWLNCPRQSGHSCTVHRRAAARDDRPRRADARARSGRPARHAVEPWRRCHPRTEGATAAPFLTRQRMMSCSTSFSAATILATCSPSSSA